MVDKEQEVKGPRKSLDMANEAGVEIYLIAWEDGRNYTRKGDLKFLKKPKKPLCIIEGDGTRWTETVMDTVPNKTVSR